MQLYTLRPSTPPPPPEMAQLQPLLQWLEAQQETLFRHPIALILVSILTALILSRFLSGFWSKKSNMYLLPSPPTLPILGNLHQLSILPHRSLRELSNKYGQMMLLHLGRAPAIIVSSAEMAKEIKKTHDVAFANRPYSVASEILFYGRSNMAFAPYGEYWRQVRKICNLELLSLRRVQTFRYVREEEVELLIKSVSQSSSKKVEINLTENLLGLANNIVSRCALGRKSEGEGSNKKLGVLSRQFIQLLEAFSFQDNFPILGFLDHVNGLFRRMKRVSKEFDAFLEQVIDEHEVPKTEDYREDREDFVDLLLRVKRDNTLDVEFTRKHIKALILDMFLGGTDTSSTTVEWTMTELMRHPKAMKKVQEEVRRVVGNKPQVDEEDLPNMDYLKAVLKETLRLHAPVPIVYLESSVDTDVKGVQVPAKTKVVVNIWAIQRDAKLWEKAEEFIPERFVNNPVDFRGQDYEYIPFGAGRRGCPGMTFGLSVVETVLANLLYWFDWELPAGMSIEDIDMDESFGSTVSKKHPLVLVPTLKSGQ